MLLKGGFLPLVQAGGSRSRQDQPNLYPGNLSEIVVAMGFRCLTAQKKQVLPCQFQEVGFMKCGCKVPMMIPQTANNQYWIEVVR